MPLSIRVSIVLLAAGALGACSGSTTSPSTTISAGSYCVQVSDVTNQLGSVAYAVALSHY